MKREVAERKAKAEADDKEEKRFLKNHSPVSTSPKKKRNY